jgi:hypothetical protein
MPHVNACVCNDPTRIGTGNNPYGVGYVYDANTITEKLEVFGSTFGRYDCAVYHRRRKTRAVDTFLVTHASLIVFNALKENSFYWRYVCFVGVALYYSCTV